ncbi:hypothetical protein TNCV_3159371 [Trichonephila clavipes]|nr:hypothetical protein TNCV_3159371 [Trichonephila clavipes]
MTQTLDSAEPMSAKFVTMTTRLPRSPVERTLDYDASWSERQEDGDGHYDGGENEISRALEVRFARADESRKIWRRATHEKSRRRGF